MKNRIGVIIRLKGREENFREVADYGLDTCQLVSWEQDLWTESLASRIKEEISKKKIYVSGFWAGWPGPAVWDFIKGPDTLGIVPKAYREERVESLKKAGKFAGSVGLPSIITHLGFIPENPSDPVFKDVVSAARQVALYLKDMGLEFWFETGQETPVTILRLIEQISTDNLGLNLDPANLILYGKANPIDALDVFGSYVRNVHVKDGFYPTDPNKLGREVRVGDGKVNFPDFIRKLLDEGFTGEFIIEREISGEQQKKDIRYTINYIKKCIEVTSKSNR